MAKLHEILAVEPDLASTANKMMDEAIATFRNKPEHFKSTHRSLRMHDEARSKEDMEDGTEMVTTVPEKLSWVRGHVIRWFDAVAAKERTNQGARADLVLDGEVLAADLPGTLLLGMEARLKTLRGVYAQIPTLLPGIEWVPSDRGPNVYAAGKPEERVKTEKSHRSSVKYDATEHHPAQVESWFSDMPVGTVTLNQWSGMMSTADKAKLIGRVDHLIRAVKKARQRANRTTVVKQPIGQIMFDYIHGE